MSDRAYLNDDGSYTGLGLGWLSRAVTNTTDNVYAFHSSFSPLMAAGAMARLSRYPHDLRRLLLEEFAPNLPYECLPDPTRGNSVEANQLIERVVVGFGDDSVAQLVNVSAVVEGCSNLLTKLLEGGRIGAGYLEQSTRFQFFDRKDADGKYKYFRPTELEPSLLAEYERVQDRIMDLYSLTVRDLTDRIRQQNPLPTGATKGEDTAWKATTRAKACDAARAMLPVAIRSTVGLVMTAQAYEKLVVYLFSEDLPEARQIGEALLREGRLVAGPFLKRADMPERGLAMAAYRREQRHKLKKMARDLRYRGQSCIDLPDSEVQLLRVWGTENEVAAASLFPWFDGGYSEAFDRVTSSESETEILMAATANQLNRRYRPPRSYEFCHALFQLTTDYGIYRDLQRHRMVDGWERQRVDPGLGYDVPPLITEFGLEGPFNEAFGLSEGLELRLRQTGHASQAEYACLLGHKVRYLFAANIRELYHFIQLRSQKEGHPNYRRVVIEMADQLRRRVPNLMAGMIFINTSESDLKDFGRRAAMEGRRLAAERLGITLPDED